MDLPLALAALALCSWLVVPGVAMLLPQRMAHLASPLRAWSPPLRPGSGLGQLCAAILIGAGSHVLWDSFTHSHSDAGGLGWLEWHLFDLSSGRAFYVHDFMQLGSSIVGLAALAVAGWRWYRSHQPAPSPATTHPLRTIGLLASSAFVITAMAFAAYGVSTDSRYRFVVYLVVASISFTTTALAGLGVVARLHERVQAS